MPPQPPGVVVIGVGNPDRGDDAVGPEVVRRLHLPPQAQVTRHESHGEGTEVMDLLSQADVVILIDAVHSGAEPGTVHRFEAQERPLPGRFFHASTHTFGVAEAVELARALHQLPSRLIVYGIEAERFDVGTGLSPAVAQALPDVVEWVQLDLRELISCAEI